MKRDNVPALVEFAGCTIPPTPHPESAGLLKQGDEIQTVPLTTDFLQEPSLFSRVATSAFLFWIARIPALLLIISALLQLLWKHQTLSVFKLKWQSSLFTCSLTPSCCCYGFFLSSPEDMLPDLRDRGREGKREGEKH